MAQKVKDPTLSLLDIQIAAVAFSPGPGNLHMWQIISKKGKKVIIVFQSTPNLGSWVQVPSYRAG